MVVSHQLAQSPRLAPSLSWTSPVLAGSSDRGCPFHSSVARMCEYLFPSTNSKAMAVCQI